MEAVGRRAANQAGSLDADIPLATVSCTSDSARGATREIVRVDVLSGMKLGAQGVLTQRLALCAGPARTMQPQKTKRAFALRAAYTRYVARAAARRQRCRHGHGVVYARGNARRLLMCLPSK
jgi:hypothetical protein